MKVGIIGAGNMGSAIAGGLCKGTIIAPEEITVSNPSQGKLNALKTKFPALNTTTNNIEATKDADIIMLAVKPWLIESVLKEIKPQTNQVIVSVAAGIGFKELQEWVNNPSEQVMFRIIPNTAVSILQSTTLIASHNATQEQEQLMLDIFNEMGLSFLIPEEKIGAATAMTSCGIAYALKYIQAVTQAGIELGIYPKDGMKMVAQSLKGAAELILQNDTHPSTEIDKVCTPGGLTIKGINTLEEHGFNHALIEAVKKSCK